MTRYEKALTLWQQKNITTDAELAEALNGHSIAFAYHSARIENENVTWHDTREIFEHDGVTSYTGDLRTLFEIRNGRDANELFLNAFQQKRPFDERFLKDLQKCLTQNTYDTRRWQLGERPGEFKHPDYVTGKEEIGAAPEDVQEEISELLAELQDVSNENALTAAAYFHAKFENIHPFADGNRRTGRLAMNYFLVTHNHPPVIIHEEDRRGYYAALEAWDSGQDLNPLRDYLREQTAKTWVSPFEHASFTFSVEGVSRAFLAQVTRHRIASFSVRSQRYVGEGDFNYILPPAIADLGDGAIEEYTKQMETMAGWYTAWQQRLGGGEKANEDARFVLPNACETKMIMTMNARELMHFFELRCCNRAQWEIRDVAWQMLTQALEVAPDVFDGCGPACLRGACPEGKKTCGKASEVKKRYERLKECLH